MNLKKYWYLMLVLLFMNCRKPYNPPPVAGNVGFLVVEGVINPGSDTTTITLSRTVPISNTNTANPVTGATISVLSDQNISYPLTETGDGNYIAPGLNLDPSHLYRLDIKTPDGKHYQSDPETALITPPVDSVGYNIVTKPDTGLQLYINAHATGTNIKYYRWEYNENWEFHSKYTSNWISNGQKLVLRLPSQYVSDCYSSDASNDIALGSTAKLSQPTLYQSPLAFIKYNSEKLETRYRIYVRQYALSPDAYNFWQILRKNTEQLGSIFDAQPSQAPGNIHCLSNPAEPVAGYVSVCTVSTKIEFVYNYNLPAWEAAYPYACQNDTCSVGTTQCNLIITNPTVYLGTDAIGNNVSPIGFYFTEFDCGNCTIRGTITPPPFWR